MKGTSGLNSIMKGNNLPHEAAQKASMKGNSMDMRHAGGRASANGQA